MSGWSREPAELERIQQEYRSRAQRIPQDRYALYREENLYFQTQISRAWLHLLRRNELLPLGDLKIADIGCGSGQWLLELLQWGARPECLYGVDLISERIAQAQSRLPAAVHLTQGNACRLPWPGGSFDLVMQSMVFSSVLDNDVQRRMAQEMRRVVRPSGSFLWLDTRRNNPHNPALRGISARRIAELFPDSRIQCRNVLLLPPLARRIAPRSWATALALETLPFACTHLAALITPVL